MAVLPVVGLFGCKEKATYDATGIFEATTVTLSAETAGKILTLPVEEGDSVTKGETIAVIDTTTLVLQLAQLSSQRGSALAASPDISAQAAALRAQIEHQKHEVERFEGLYADKAIPAKQVDDSRAQLRVLQGQLDALVSTLGKNKNSISDNSTAIEYQRRQIEEQIIKSRVISPISGTVLTKYAEPGEFATPGRPLVKIANLNDIYLRSYFTANQLADIKIGQKVTVIADFGGDKQFEYPGVITWIAQESEFTPKSIQTNDSRANLVYAVKVRVHNDGRLKLGQYGEVRL